MRLARVLLISVLALRCSPAPPPRAVAPVSVRAGIAQNRAALSQRVSGRELLARQIVDELGAFEFGRVAARFDPELRGRLSAAALAQTWRGVLDKAGAYLRTSSVRFERREASEVVFLRTSFERAELETLVALDARDQIVGLAIRPLPPSATWYAPSYADQSLFQERAVRVPDPAHFCGTGTCGLPGTLSVPNGRGPFPAVVLLHGSGPQDRDQTLGESRPFRDLAWGLASRGIAVLRYEKRTHLLRGRWTAAELEALTVQEEFVDDALSAIALLRRTPEIDATRIFVLGHSQGGTVLARLGRADPALAGFIALAAPLRPLEDIVLEQVRFLARVDGREDPNETAELERLAAQVARVKTLRTTSRVPASELPLGIPSAYWLDLAANPPGPVLAAEMRPFLILQGERDYQVTLADFALWRALLGHSRAARFKSFPQLNHLFIAGDGPILPSEYMKPGHVAGEVIDDVARFVLVHSRAPQ